MTKETIKIALEINGQERTLDILPHETLLAVLRREGYFGVKHGCEDGSCGACTVLVDGVPPRQPTSICSSVFRGKCRY